jgi:hypothetical protein
MVRDPGFGSAMANQNYANFMRDQQARLAAERGQFTQGRLMGAPTEQPNPNAGKPLYFQALEGELQKQFLDKNPQLKPKPGTALNPQLMQENYAKFLQNQMAEVNKFNAANPQYAQNMRRPNRELARQAEQKFLEGLLDYSKVSPNQINVLNQLKSSYLKEGQGGATRSQNPQMQAQQPIPPSGGRGPIPGGNMQIPNLSKEEIENLNNPNAYFKGKDQGFLQFASPSDIQLRWNDIPQAQKDELFARYQPSPIQMQGAMASQPQVPQNQQMQNYQNLLQQGIQRSNTMNQDAATNFANLQAGAPTPQPAAPAKVNPVVPIAGMGMQQPRKAPAPRNFSTVNTPSARFG